MVKNLAVSVLLFVSTLGVASSFDTLTSDQVSPDRIYQAVLISYDDQAQRLDTRSTFREGGMFGATIRLVGASHADLNGRDIPAHQNWVGETNYKTQEFGPNPGQVNLSWTDSRGRVFGDVVRIRGARLGGVPGMLSRRQDTTLTWTGEPLQAGDTVQVQIISDDGGVVSIQATSQTVRIPAASMLSLKPGLAHVSISRTSANTLRGVTSAGGRITVEFMAAESTVSITE